MNEQPIITCEFCDNQATTTHTSAITGKVMHLCQWCKEETIEGEQPLPPPPAGFTRSSLWLIDLK